MTQTEAQRVHAILQSLDGCSVREIQDALRMTEQVVMSTTMVRLEQPDWTSVMGWLCTMQPNEG